MIRATRGVPRPSDAPADAELVQRVRARLLEDGDAVAPSPVRVAAALRAEGRVLGDRAVLAVVGALRDELVGAGPLAVLLTDPDVTDVLVNAPDSVWVDRGRGLERTGVRFADEAAVRRLAQRLASSAGRRLDEAAPWCDVRLADGTRLHAVLPPVARPGTVLSLRVPARRPWTLPALEAAGAVGPRGAQLLRDVVGARLSFLVSGGTGTGKTTLLATLLGLVPAHERVVLVEDLPELVPDHPHVVALAGRAPNVEGAGEVTLRDLVRQALRMRPDRLVVGECRGAEVVDLLAALNTGHEGGCGTVHANSAQRGAGAAGGPRGGRRPLADGGACPAGAARSTSCSTSTATEPAAGCWPRSACSSGTTPGSSPSRRRSSVAAPTWSRPLRRRCWRSGSRPPTSRVRDVGVSDVSDARPSRPRSSSALPSSSPAPRRWVDGTGDGSGHRSATWCDRWRPTRCRVGSPGPWLFSRALVVVVAPPSLAVAVLAAVGGLLVATRRRAVAAARTAQELTASVAEVATALAADLAAGHPPLGALAALADEQRAPPHTRARAELADALAAVVSGARLGADIPSGLRRRAAVPGAEGLRAVAAGWEVAERTGAGLAPVLEQVAVGLRDELAADRAVAAALAGSQVDRATARWAARRGARDGRGARCLAARLPPRHRRRVGSASWSVWRWTSPDWCGPTGWRRPPCGRPSSDALGRGGRPARRRGRLRGPRPRHRTGSAAWPRARPAATADPAGRGSRPPLRPCERRPSSARAGRRSSWAGRWEWPSGSWSGVLVPRAVRGLRTRADARTALLLRADLPLAGDLLAAALAAGVAPGAAAGAVGRAVGGSLGDALVRVARATELGASPATAWARLVEDPATAALARPLVRASERGAPAAAVAARVSVELRRGARDRAQAAAEVVAVRGVGPLGLCFLPAFVLLGVVPLVAGSVLAVLG